MYSLKPMPDKTAVAAASILKLAAAWLAAASTSSSSVESKGGLQHGRVRLNENFIERSLSMGTC